MACSVAAERVDSGFGAPRLGPIAATTVLETRSRIGKSNARKIPAYNYTVHTTRAPAKTG